MNNLLRTLGIILGLLLLQIEVHSQKSGHLNSENLSIAEKDSIIDICSGYPKFDTYDINALIFIGENLIDNDHSLDTLRIKLSSMDEYNAIFALYKEFSDLVVALKYLRFEHSHLKNKSIDSTQIPSFYIKYIPVIFKTKYVNDIIHKISIEKLNEYKSEIDKILSELINIEYIHYTVPTLKSKAIKAINIHHDNDVFGFFPLIEKFNINEDRNYTGGARVEIITDYLKLRFLNLLPKRNWLRYQSFFIGGEAYTPRIRFTIDEVEDYFSEKRGYPVDIYPDNRTNLQPEALKEVIDSFLIPIHLTDRPFASYYYVGRSTYRMNTNASFRWRSDFTIGTIGSEAPKAVQASIHKDISVKAQKVLLWENQLSAGGRLAWNADHFFDISLNNKDTTSAFNIIISPEIRFGTRQTSAGVGLKIANRSLKDYSMNYDIHTRRVYGTTGQGRNKDIFKHWLFMTGVKVNRIIHNSMLEGIGFLTTYENDPLDDEISATNRFALKPNEVNRFVFNWDVIISFRTHHSTFYYRNTVLSKEFNRKEAKTYIYGTFGINFYFDN